MVTTRAQEASTSRAVERAPPAEQSEGNLSARSPAPLPLDQSGRIDVLTHQVQDLTAAMRGLQEHCLAAISLPPRLHPPYPPHEEGQGGNQPPHGRTPPEASHHSTPKPPPQETSKRRRSHSRHSDHPHRRHGEKSHHTRSARRRASSSSSSDSPAEGPVRKEARRTEQRLDEYRQRLDELSRRIASPSEVDYDRRPPLSRRIMEEPVPPRFRLPQLDPYDGTSDPLDHLESYKVFMQVQGATDALLCVAFPATLRKAARAWYSRLPPRSINSFKQLERSFLAHFDACRKIPRVADSLFAVQQKSGEALKDFVARFKDAALEVYNLEDSVATLALKRGLRPSRFAYSLDKKPPGSYAELLNRAQKYIRADEADSSRREADKGSNKKQVPVEPTGGRSKKPDPPRRSDNRPPALAPKDRFTPLLAPISHILLEIEEEPYLRRPPPMKPGVPRSKEVYCRYHRDYGHDTEDCRQLKKAIEELVQQGHLGKFVRRGHPATVGPSTLPPPQAGVDNTPTEKTVAMISWGAGGGSKRQREEGESHVIPFLKKTWRG